jgi:hypothetical protein
MEQDGLFPQRVLLGKRSVGWIEQEVIAWVKSRQKGTLPCPKSTNRKAPAAEPQPTA